jgi:hypothetical protein
MQTAKFAEVWRNQSGATGHIQLAKFRECSLHYLLFFTNLNKISLATS